MSTTPCPECGLSREVWTEFDGEQGYICESGCIQYEEVPVSH